MSQSSELKIPLKLFSTKNISFTYPDSFFSEWLAQNKEHELYNSELNGKLEEHRKQYGSESDLVEKLAINRRRFEEAKAVSDPLTSSKDAVDSSKIKIFGD